MTSRKTIEAINDMDKKINDISSEILEDEDDKLTNIKEQIPHLILNKNDEKAKNITIEDNIDLNHGLTATNRTEELNTHFRTDNIRIEAFIALMVFLKEFFLKFFNLDFSSFKCEEVLGPAIGQMKKILNLQIYQILCYYPANIIKILETSKKIKTKREQAFFYYFMTRTYEELYNRYITGDINFPLIRGGTVRICCFTTLAKEINKKKEKLKDKGKSQKYIGEKMAIFEKLSLNMIDDIKGGKFERKGKKEEKQFITVIISEFELKRMPFDEIDDYNGISLEEK